MPSSRTTRFLDLSQQPPVDGFLQDPVQAAGAALILTHGAGADCGSKLLVSVAEAFVQQGFLVLRCNLPFRQQRPHGPPSPGSAERDREGLKRAVQVIKAKMAGRIFLGGHSYGGRQASILAADTPELVTGLLLLSYPLHPPRRPDQLRTAHFPRLTTPVQFVHGSRDPFASVQELHSAISVIPARHATYEVEDAGHELLGRKNEATLPAAIAKTFISFIG